MRTLQYRFRRGSEYSVVRHLVILLVVMIAALSPNNHGSCCAMPDERPADAKPDRWWIKIDIGSSDQYVIEVYCEQADGRKTLLRRLVKDAPGKRGVDVCAYVQRSIRIPTKLGDSAVGQTQNASSHLYVAIRKRGSFPVFGIWFPYSEAKNLGIELQAKELLKAAIEFLDEDARKSFPFSEETKD